MDNHPFKQSREYKLVTKALEGLGVKFDYASGQVLMKDRQYNYNQTLTILLLSVKKVTKMKLDAALSLWWGEQEDNFKEDKKTLLCPIDTIGSPELAQWIDAICYEGNEMSYLVMQHWLWCVKRKLFGLEVSDPICPVLYGKTRGGKTTAIKALLQPLEGMFTSITLRQLVDERNWHLLGTNLVLFLDELAGAKDEAIETIKMLITETKLKQRIMYTTTHSNINLISSFIGTSNKQIRHVVNDTTSGSRFWELRCKDTLDWHTINNIDYLSLWNSIDYCCPSPLGDSPIRAKVLELQHEKIRAKSSTEMWVEEVGLQPGTLEFLTSDLFSEYKLWCHGANEKVTSRSKWGSELRGMGFVSRRIPAGRVWGVGEFQRRELAWGKVAGLGNQAKVEKLPNKV